jgi:sec-independent protein translocase protein TatA
MMPQLGAPELIIILVIIVLIFGVGKLPEVGQALGKGIREFRGAAEGTEEAEAAAAPKPAPQPVAPPVVAPAPVAPVPVAVEAPRQPVVAEVVRPAPVAAMSSYTVAAGDTLDTIASHHGVTVDELMTANGYGSRDRVLYAGDRLQIPVAQKTA